VGANSLTTTANTTASATQSVDAKYAEEALTNKGASQQCVPAPFYTLSRSRGPQNQELTVGSNFIVLTFPQNSGWSFDPANSLDEVADYRSNDRPDGTPRWFNYVKRRLDQLEEAAEPEPDDEDSYPKPPRDTVAMAWETVHNLFNSDTPTPSVVPATEGGVEFEWHKYGWDLVIAILPRGISVWARNRILGENWSSPLSERYERVRTILESLT
jgi:hypothetical protein